MHDAFLAPRFLGKRFKASAIPLDVLKDIAVLEDFIRALARDAFLRANPERKRVPRGFIDGMSLRLAAITPGSAVAEISLVAETHGLFESPLQRYYEDGRNTLLTAIAKASRNEDLTQLMSSDLFGYFDSFGRGLLADEAIEFVHPSVVDPIRYTPDVRRQLRGVASSLRTYTEEISIRLRVPELDQEHMSFNAVLAGSERITGTFEAPHRDALMTGFNSFEQGGSVLIEGIAGFSRSGKLQSIESIDSATALHVLDVPARLEQLAELEDGWLNGYGKTLDRIGLDRLAQAFEQHYSGDLDLPYTFPTEAGDIRFEWRFTDGTDASLEVDLETQIGYLHIYNVRTGAEEELELPLTDGTAWLALEERLASGQEAAR